MAGFRHRPIDGEQPRHGVGLEHDIVVQPQEAVGLRLDRVVEGGPHAAGPVCVAAPGENRRRGIGLPDRFRRSVRAAVVKEDDAQPRRTALSSQRSETGERLVPAIVAGEEHGQAGIGDHDRVPAKAGAAALSAARS